MSTVLDAKGEYTVSFRCDGNTIAVLSALAKHRGQSVHTVAKCIVEHWITKTHRDIQREESRSARNAAFQSNAGIVTRPVTKK